MKALTSESHSSNSSLTWATLISVPKNEQWFKYYLLHTLLYIIIKMAKNMITCYKNADNTLWLIKVAPILNVGFYQYQLDFCQSIPIPNH